MKHKTTIFAVLLLFFAATVFAQTFGTKKRMPRPAEFGNVTINNSTKGSNIAPVVFPHWLHRVNYTCRLCHVDLGFAMEAGQTDFREIDNQNGLYCGACHNGKIAFAAEEKGSDNSVTKHCSRCHSKGREIKFTNEFYEVVAGFPRARFGNKVDWLKAEEQGLLDLTDYLEGISIKRRELEIPVESVIDSKTDGMPDIIFSHEKHAVWNGCELCHPQIFGIKKASTVYEMQQIFDGKYCGACHGKVAFMTTDCQACHSKNVY